MNSQVFESLESDLEVSKIELVSTSALNETYYAAGKGYLHLSNQPSIDSKEEALLLDRYVYTDKSKKIAQKTMDATILTRDKMPHQITIPSILHHGMVDNTEPEEAIAYWLDSEILGVNAKLHRDILKIEDYISLIDWIVAVQGQVEKGGVSVETQYTSYADAFRMLINRGYFANSVDSKDIPILERVADSIAVLSEDSLLDTDPVFKHGDLHIANVLKIKDGSLGIIDFEASNGGPGDNLKDIMKLLHMDYVFFDVQKTKEGAFLTDGERVALMHYYIASSKLEGVEKLREKDYLINRIALDSLMRYTVRLTLAARMKINPKSVTVEQLLNNITAVITEAGV